MKINNIYFLIFCFLLLISCSDNNKKFVIGDDQEINLNIKKERIMAQNLKVDSNQLSYLSAIIKTVYGNIVFKFYPQKAPNTVTRIIKLIQDGIYDNLTFHRVIPNYIIQTGDPTNTGNGGTGIKIKAEFNNIQHIKGTIAMARVENNIDSADSQFYIALTTLPHLDGKYTVIGQVIEGLEILSKITQGDKVLSISIKK